MTSKDDDTLPLPGLSQDLSPDATVDEDFIPTSQPQSTGSSKMSKTPESSFNKSAEELKSSVSDSRIDDTLPPEAVINQSVLDKDKSTDFIPDTDTKKGKMVYSNPEASCKKKLAVFGGEDMFKLPPWEADTSKIPESPALETQNISILNDSPMKARPEKCEDSITEIVVNDSAETVDLDATPVRIKASDSERKLEISCSSNSYGERCEETQIFDNSSVLLLEQPGAASLELENSGVTSEKLYLQETVEDGETKVQVQGKVNGFGSSSSPPFAVAETSEKKDSAVAAGVTPKQEVQLSSNGVESNNASIVTRKVDFKLTVSCFITINTKTNKVLQKVILNVNETPKPKREPVYLEADNASDKSSKRYSTSSSGSVYSDKMGPFALPKRISTVSDQTDSSEEDFGSILQRERRALERAPWINEYLLPLKMDDIMLLSIENQELLKRPNMMSSPRRLQKKRCNGVNHLQEILESSTTEQTSHTDPGAGELLQSNGPSPRELTNSEEALRKETPESSEALLPEEEKTTEEKNEQEESTTVVSPPPEVEEEPKAVVQEDKPELEPIQEERREEEGGLLRFGEGLAVFARWTDKRYYSGVLCGGLKNERWEVQFDDGTRKTIREDFVIPVEWLKVGALVFAMTGDEYESGQIVDIRKGAEADYVVELDTKKKEVSVKVSDLRLTDVMAGIVREKYKPLIGTPRGKADIDFDNVVSGKRLREQRTPLRPPATAQTASSGPKKKSSSKPKKDESLQAVKETPQNGDGGKKTGGLKTENGHLVEDKVISADSPSGTETGETPLRGSGKEARKKGKPRSLSYEAEESRSGKKKSSWLAPDGTPIPGPSGVKFKKRKRAEEPAKKSPIPPKSVQSTEKSKRKRKLDESVDDSIQKKSMKEEESKVKTRSRKG